MNAVALVVMTFAVVSTLSVGRNGALSAAGGPMAQQEVVIHDYRRGLGGVRATNAGVRLAVERDTSFPDEPVLVVQYPERTSDPAGRDVQCEAQASDWSGGHAIVFKVKPAAAVKLSVSFIDRHRVMYTVWRDLEGGIWQTVRIPFEDFRPNPYFQPPDAQRDAPLDVSQVRFIAFAPQSEAAGRLSLTNFVLVR